MAANQPGDAERRSRKGATHQPKLSRPSDWVGIQQRSLPQAEHPNKKSLERRRRYEHQAGLNKDEGSGFEPAATNILPGCSRSRCSEEDRLHVERKMAEGSGRSSNRETYAQIGEAGCTNETVVESRGGRSNLSHQKRGCVPVSPTVPSEALRAVT
jgi:hypothetical protein